MHLTCYCHQASLTWIYNFLQEWQPPFAVDVDTFTFTPRIQRLNELEVRFHDYSLCVLLNVTLEGKKFLKFDQILII